MILGIDEVGRGPWAGPLVVGAVALNDASIEGLTDSKKLTKAKREILYKQINESSASVGLGWVHADELDVIGLSQSLVEATKRAVAMVTTPYHEIIIDGTVNFLKDTNKGQFVTTLKKADLLITSVSAASIVAKVARDKYMTDLSERYPTYGFADHVGYGTAKHREAIEKHGITPEHRLSFAPLKRYQIDKSASEKAHGVDTVRKNPTTKIIGDVAEECAADYLRNRGHKIIDRNWKTKYCEIDIVSTFNGVIYFCEVKYRRQQFAHGGGLAAITSKKRKQMEFAAKLYASANHIQKTDMRMTAIALSGDPPVIETYIEID